jgi:AraC family transcriptional regulator, regulatory protein of adaptative response / methylated-DNA-[protein]-cysteine methyltransferase
MATMVAESATNPPRPADAEAWRAVASRDARYDGRFVYAVRSTRVYCRPSCPSRRPLRENVSFFAAPGDAERAGYRACLRCDPRAEKSDRGGGPAIERALKYLDAHDDRAVSLAELATHAGLSPSHLQRSFKRAVGMSPKEYQDARRVSRFKSRLRSGDTVSRATYEAGFGSSSRVYERTNELLGMTPAAYRRGGEGVEITYSIADTSVGRVLVATTDRGVCAVELGATDADVERALATDFPNAHIERSGTAHDAWVRGVLERIREPRRTPAADVPLDLGGTAFQQRVWNALREIPAGERRSYREVAASIGRPSAVRAVARACATNRLAVIVPCHRVVREDGSLAGYKWGVTRKRRLLDDEAG